MVATEVNGSGLKPGFIRQSLHAHQNLIIDRSWKAESIGPSDEQLSVDNALQRLVESLMVHFERLCRPRCDGAKRKLNQVHLVSPEQRDDLGGCGGVLFLLLHSFHQQRKVL